MFHDIYSQNYLFDSVSFIAFKKEKKGIESFGYSTFTLI